MNDFDLSLGRELGNDELYLTNSPPLNWINKRRVVGKITKFFNGEVPQFSYIREIYRKGKPGLALGLQYPARSSLSEEEQEELTVRIEQRWTHEYLFKKVGVLNKAGGVYYLRHDPTRKRVGVLILLDPMEEAPAEFHIVPTARAFGSEIDTGHPVHKQQRHEFDVGKAPLKVLTRIGPRGVPVAFCITTPRYVQAGRIVNAGWVQTTQEDFLKYIHPSLSSEFAQRVSRYMEFNNVF